MSPLKILDIVPGWVWASFLALALVGGGIQAIELARAQRDAAGARAALAQERQWHSDELARATAEVLGAQSDLQDAHDALERAHEDRRRATVEYERRLAAAAAGGRLRDPNATACRGSAPGAEAPAAAAGGAAHDAEAGGLLSAQLTGLLQRLTREADEVNDAYAACREDALQLRASLERLQMPLSPPPGPASTGSP